MLNISFIMSSKQTAFVVIGSYLVILLISYLCNTPYFYTNLTAEDIDEAILTSYSQPIIGKNNATKLIKQRIQVVKDDYQKILQSSDWKLLRSSTNVTVELLMPKTLSQWPLYIKTTASIHAPVQDVFNMFEWSNLQSTAKAIDPFFEDLFLIADPNKEIKVFGRTTTNLLFLSKREFILAMMNSSQQKAFNYPVTNPKHSVLRDHTDETTIPKGALIQTHVSVKPSDELSSGNAHHREGKYMKSYQDYNGWFFEDGYGGTNVVSIMQVDPGPDVPKWLFKHTVGGTAVWSIHALIKLMHK